MVGYEPNIYESIPVPRVVVDPIADNVESNLNKNRAGNIFIIGNFPTTTVLSEAFSVYDQKIKDALFYCEYKDDTGEYITPVLANKDYNKYADVSGAGTVVPFHCENTEESTKEFKDVLSLLFDKGYTEIINGVETVVTHGAQSVVFVNTSLIDLTKNDAGNVTGVTITSRELSPSVLNKALKTIQNDQFDILYIAEPLDDVHKDTDSDDPSLVVVKNRTTLELSKEFVDIQYNRKNPFGIVGSIYYESFTDPTPNGGFSPDDDDEFYPLVGAPTPVDPYNFGLDVMTGLIGIAEKISTPGTADTTGKALNTKYNGGFYGIALQNIIAKTTATPSTYDRREVAAFIANMKAGREVDESLSQVIYPMFDKIDYTQDLDLGYPEDGDNDTSGHGWTLSKYGYSIFTTADLVHKKIMQVNSLVPTQKSESGSEHHYQQYNVAHHHIRNYIINKMDLRNFLGKKRIISVLDDLAFDVEKVLTDAETDELVLQYTDSVVPNKQFSDVVDIKINLTMANFIGEIRLEIVTTITANT